jgi:hypothetical protein
MSELRWVRPGRTWEKSKSRVPHRVKIAIGPSGLLDWELVDLILGKPARGRCGRIGLGMINCIDEIATTNCSAIALKLLPNDLTSPVSPVARSAFHPIEL